MMTLEEVVERAAADPTLGQLSFENVEVAGFGAAVARLVPPARAVELWRRARALVVRGTASVPGESLPWPVLTHDGHVHPDIDPVRPLESLSLAEVRTRRSAVVDAEPEARTVFDSLASALPQAEPYEERDAFFEYEPDDSQLSLVLVDRPLAEAVLPFSPDGEGTAPQQSELTVMLRHLFTTYGAEPLYASGNLLELEVPCPPRRLSELRTLAQDFFLLSQGQREGAGFEAPDRLLRRLMSQRWVVWWYGTTWAGLS
jgi:hypothetical protein